MMLFVDSGEIWYGEDTEDNADMWATLDETRTGIVDLYRRVGEHSEATIDAVPLDGLGRVAWWSEGRDVVPLHLILVHLIAETHRHAGHADIVRELIDGAVGLRADNDNVPPAGPDWWAGYRDRLEQTARQA